jgi:hypothetical protein
MRDFLAFALVFSSMLALAGCGDGSKARRGSEPRLLLKIGEVQSSVSDNGEHSLQNLIAPLTDSNAFFETAKPFPLSFTFLVSPAETEGVRTYALITGNHGNDSILRMPRTWVFYGSSDGANWTVLDRQDDPRPWKPAEERQYRLPSMARYKQFRIEFTRGGAEPVLRIYGIRFYAD